MRDLRFLNLCGRLHRFLDQPLDWKKAVPGSYADAFHKRAVSDQRYLGPVDFFFGNCKYLGEKNWDESVGLVGTVAVLPTFFPFDWKVIGAKFGETGEKVGVTAAIVTIMTVTQVSALVGSVPKSLMRAQEAAMAAIDTGFRPSGDA